MRCGLLEAYVLLPLPGQRIEGHWTGTSSRSGGREHPGTIRD